MPSRATAEETTTITSTHDAVETAIDLSKDAVRGSWEELTHSRARKLTRWAALVDKDSSSDSKNR